jgi:hypothetical protein
VNARHQLLLRAAHARRVEVRRRDIRKRDATAPIEKYTPIQAESSIRCAIMAGASTAGKARPSAIKVC